MFGWLTLIAQGTYDRPCEGPTLSFYWALIQVFVQMLKPLRYLDYILLDRT